MRETAETIRSVEAAVKYHEIQLNDITNENHFLNNKTLVCDCKGKCVCN